MAESETTGAVTTFGVEETAVSEPVVAADAMVSFLESSALALIAGAVVAVFLIYQFARWFMANYRVEGMGAVMGERDSGAVPAAQMPAETGRRSMTGKRGRS